MRRQYNFVAESLESDRPELYFYPTFIIYVVQSGYSTAQDLSLVLLHLQKRKVMSAGLRSE